MTIMDITQLQSRISALIGEYIPKPTLRRWAAEEIITSPERHSKGKGGGRGRVSDWSDKAVEEAAACWYVRYWKLTLVPPSAKVLSEVKRISEQLYENPLWNPYHAGELSPLVVLWTCAVEKIRQGRSLLWPALVTFNWSTELLKEKRAEKLALSVTIGEPVQLTDTMGDFGHDRFGFLSRASKQIGRFSRFAEEDQIVTRLDGRNTMEITTHGLVNILASAGLRVI
jgi:hypothetical protein